jgi:ABC-type Na+ efflux pump permease subunit
MRVERRTIRDGIIVGLIGYATVAFLYSAFDVLAARDGLHTVNMLGRVVFRGLRDSSVLLFPAELDPGAIFAYNVLHLILALGIGLLVATLVSFGDRTPERRRAVRIVIAAGFIVTVAIVGLLTAPMRPVLSWWSIVVANALSAFFAALYLLDRRPGLWRRWLLRRA